ncbi:hypothetical protein GCM10007061_18120 [Kocuria marina]|nr:hypothetical protein GCM10007061_18120 [Kocuria marina]
MNTVVTWLSSHPTTPTPAMMSKIRHDHAAAIRTGVVTMVCASGALGPVEGGDAPSCWVTSSEDVSDWGRLTTGFGDEPAWDVVTLDGMPLS